MPESVDMTDFEKQFSEGRYSLDMGNEDFERLHFLRDRIADASGVIDLKKEHIGVLEAKTVAVQLLIRRVKKLLQRLQDRIRPIDEQIMKTKAEIRENEKTHDALVRELSRLMDEINARKRFNAQRNLLNEATSHLPWHDLALPHQLEGAHRLVSAERAILGDKPGLGKTLEAIMTIDLLRAKGKAKKVLIFTPKPVLEDFRRAFEHWSPGKFVHVLNQSLKGIKSEILDSFRHWPELIVLTNYEVWRKDQTIKDKLKACAFDTIILDEAHVLKSKSSVTFEGIREIVYAENACPKCGSPNLVNHWNHGKMCGTCETRQENFGDFCSIKTVIPMTGTPILNKPQELWPLLNLIDREGFPKENYFLEDYCSKQFDYENNRYFWTFGPGGSEKLLKKLGMKYTARNRESAGVVMPPQEVKHHYLELDPEKYPRQAKFVELLRDKARLVFSEDDQLTQNQVLAWYTRMRQAASWPDAIKIKGCAHEPLCDFGDNGQIACIKPTVVFPPPEAPPIGESVIMDEAEDIIRSAVDSEDRIVVFSMFKDVLKELEKRCQASGIRAARFDGETPQKMRQPIIDDFNANVTKVGEHQFDVMLCQYQTASVGLNLHGAQQLLCVEREWNPGKEEQTIDRLRRIDSQYNSTVHILHCAGTATELIDAIQDQKKGMLEGFEADANLIEAMRKFLEG